MNAVAANVKADIKWYSTKLLTRLRRFDPESNLLICAAPRGGSTWMAEMINRIPGTALLYEPLALDDGSNPGSPFRSLGFWRRQYIPEDADWPEAEEAFERLLSGKLLNNWTCMYASFTRFLMAERMVVKLCRANALLPWLTKIYQFKCPPILLVRHPFAVAASQLAWNAGNFDYRGYGKEGRYCRDFYSRHTSFLSTLRTREELLVALWCLSTLVPLRNAANNRRWITIYYERLLTEPESELRRLFDRWRMPLPGAVLERIHVASATTLDSAVKNDAEHQVAKWQRRFTRVQLKKMKAVLDYFGVTEYDDVSPYPVMGMDTAVEPA